MTIKMTLSPSSTNYFGDDFATQPQMSVTGLTPPYSVSGTITLSAYTDSHCGTPARGSLANNSVTISSTQLYSQFSGLSYAGTDPFEEVIYLGWSFAGTFTCEKNPISMRQHFSRNYGYRTYLNNGAGAAGMAVRGQISDFPYTTVLDSKGRSIIAGSSSNAAGFLEMAL